jgi:polar amino acid transport system substrate-binding protein
MSGLPRRGLLRAAAGAVGAAGLSSAAAAPAPAAAATEPGPALDPSPAAILEGGRLVVAMGRFEAPPFFSKAEGRDLGQDVWFAEELARVIGVRLEIRRDWGSFNEVVDAVDRQQAHLAISKVSITYPRALRMLFSQPYLVLRHALAFNRVALAQHLGNRDLAVQLRRWDGDIGVIAKSSFVDFARQRFPRARVVEMGSWDALVDAVLRGKILCAYRDELEVKRIGVQLPSASLHMRTVVLSDTRDSIGMVFHRSATHLQQVANIFLDHQAEALSANGLLDKYKPLLKS